VPVAIAVPAVALTICPRPALAQQAQNPSPMVEHTRAHPRLAETRPPGRREALELGTLFLPERLVPKSPQRSTVPLLVVFHAGTWLPEVTGHEARTAVIGVQITAGSAGYAAAVADARRFPSLLEDAERKAGVRFRPITLAGWSAGCGALRELLRQPASVSRLDRIIAIDGIHTDYVDGKPGPLESRIDTRKLEPWLAFARKAIAGRKRLLILHTEIFPGTFASTTETADWLIRACVRDRDSSASGKARPCGRRGRRASCSRSMARPGGPPRPLSPSVASGRRCRLSA
jgi:hypothetical protein